MARPLLLTPWPRSNVPAERASRAPRVNVWTASDVREILIARGWLATADGMPSVSGAAAESWMADAAAWLGPHAADRDALAGLLGLVFRYDAREVLASPEAHAVMLRKGAREAIRGIGLEILAGPALDSERFNAIVTAVKQRFGASGRALFHPVRLALAGRAGEGELDRVILLLAAAESAPGLAPVKSARQRMLEFCAVLD
jgi:hypothetical protein